ncbi:MAG: thermonuclease family protein [Deltaproteobacteria bacterium]
MNIVRVLRGRCVRALAVLFLALGPASCYAPAAGPVRVTQVVDGDTVVLSTGAEVRYIGIDAPETHRRKAGAWIDVDEPFGAEAGRVNAQLVLDKSVRLEFDEEQRDTYGRLLGYVWVGQGQSRIMAQEELLRRGLAFLYTLPPNVKYADRLKAAQDEARRAGRGLWSRDLSISSREAGEHVGERRLVRGTVEDVLAAPNTTVLLLEGFRVVIFSRDIGLFLGEGVRPEKDYTGREIRAYGLIKTYRGHPEMIVSHPGQIEVL